jgi:signal transduction histidine kinase/ActR/RegA family two-component response regulator
MPRTRRAPGIPLRRHLFVLTAAGILPLAVFAGIGLYGLRRQQGAEAERVGIELARSVANAVNSELGSVISVLEALATTPTLDRGDLAGFRERADRIMAGRHEWAAIGLAASTGTKLVDTRFSQGTALSRLAEKDSFDWVVQNRRPAVGSLTQHWQNEWLFAVRVPVVRGGGVRYVVTALIRPEQIRTVLTRQGVPDDWVISIIDATGRRVARSRAHEQNVGGYLSETAQRVVDRGAMEGAGVSYSLEGERIFTPYSRVAGAGWIAVLGLPTAVVDAAVYRSLAIYGGGVLLSIAIGAAGAMWVGRSIARPIGDLRAAAEALGRRQTPNPPQTAIEEIREVGVALKTAADELARGEAEREELLRKERLARETAEAADRAKDEFMAVLSHELRTPLNAVFGWARWLQSGQLNDPSMVARATDAIARNAHVQVQLVDDLLDLARITSGKMRLDVSPLDLRTVLHGALEAVRPAADAKTIAIETSSGADPCVVAGDSARLQQVVWNLLMNAVKFTPNGGRVRLELRRASSHVQIVVSDTGQGIAPTVLPYVFERFRQGDSSSTRTNGGLGLGLALVKHLVELHGGAVAAQSPGEGHGTTVVVTLPINLATSPSPWIARPPAGLSAREVIARSDRLQGVRVVITDDDPDAVVLIATILGGCGAEVRTCSSARAALDLVRECRPDVLVSDIGMPNEDGYALIARVRALPTEDGGATPAVALSAYGRPQDRLRAIAAGFNMHVPKPVDPGELTTIVADLAHVEATS